MSETLTIEDVRNELRRATGEGRFGARKAWVNRHGFTQGFISMVLAGKTAPSPRLCEALGIRKHPMRVGRAHDAIYERAQAG